MKKLKILIVGGSSFIGSNLYYFLIKNYDIYVTKNINKKLNPIFKKINKKKIVNINLDKINFHFNSMNFDIVINCIGNTKNYKNYKYNIKKSNVLVEKYLKFLQELNYKTLIHISSSMVYGFSNRKFTEKSKCLPNTKYGDFKLNEEKKIIKYLNINNKKIIILRLFSIFGKKNKVGSLFDVLNSKKKIVINNPYHEFDLISFKYFSEIIIKIIKYRQKLKKNEIINCCSGKKLNPMYLINILKKNKNVIINKNKTIKKSRQIGNNSKLLKLLKLPQFNLMKEIKLIYD